MKASLLIAAAASAVLADDSIPEPAKRRALLPRQTGFLDTGDLSEDCLDNAVEFLQSMPTPSPELLQAIDTPTDEGCFSLPKSLNEDFSSYSSAVASWASDNADLVDDAESNCPQATLMPSPDFCEGMGPEDSDAARNTGVSMIALVCAAVGIAIAL